MDVPQPASEPYSLGDHVEIYLAEEDPDAEYHGTAGVIVERFEDELGSETGRALDRLQYRVKEESTGEMIPVDFRHGDLVPGNL